MRNEQFAHIIAERAPIFGLDNDTVLHGRIWQFNDGLERVFAEVKGWGYLSLDSAEPPYKIRMSEYGPILQGLPMEWETDSEVAEQAVEHIDEE